MLPFMVNPMKYLVSDNPANTKTQSFSVGVGTYVKKLSCVFVSVSSLVGKSYVLVSDVTSHDNAFLSNIT